MRVLLFTGKGGVGKTTAAAGTAVLAARAGSRTLVLSTDAAHSLGDAFGARIGTDPVEVERGCWVQQVDAQRRFERSWAEVQDYLLSVLDATGVDPVAAEELTVLPGAEEVLALLELRDQVASGRWDVVVVDCAPTAETLRLLALPEALGWYVDRVLPGQRRVVSALRPVLSRAAGVPMPRGTVFDALERLHADLGDVHALLTGPDTTARLVLTPERVVLAEARRALTTLSLYGYSVDGVVANRVFPGDESGGEWQQGWVRTQREVLAEVDDSFAPLPVWRVAYGADEPVGADSLAAVAEELYDGSDPLARHHGPAPLTLSRTGGAVQLVLSLPFAARDDVDLARHGDDLVVTVGAYRRVITLPSTLRNTAVAGARLSSGRLRVRFEEAG